MALILKLGWVTTKPSFLFLGDKMLDIENLTFDEINKKLDELEKMDLTYTPNQHHYNKMKDLLWTEKVKRIENGDV